LSPAETITFSIAVASLLWEDVVVTDEDEDED
jgi:hypothetical protein